MTDTTQDDLVKRLRQPIGLSAFTQEPVQDKLKMAAADRIEELSNCVAVLEAKLKTAEEIGRAFEEDAGQLREKLAKAAKALDEAVYLLAPTEKDMERQAGVYRIVTALAELTGGKDE